MRKSRNIRATIACLAIITLFSLAKVYAGDISFSGGYTKVNLQEGSRSVTLSGGAKVSTKDLVLTSDSIELYGENYCYVSCKGNVQASRSDSGISFSSPSLFYDRTTGLVRSDSWIEIQDTRNEAALSGAWFEYDMEESLMTLQMMAKIIKVTDDGMMVCRADSIQFDSNSRTVTLKGNASVDWNDDIYKAAMIVVDLDTNGIAMYGSISGEVNG